MTHPVLLCLLIEKDWINYLWRSRSIPPTIYFWTYSLSRSIHGNPDVQQRINPYCMKWSFSAKNLFRGINDYRKLRPEVIKLFSCSTQLSIIFFLLINVKMPTIVGILRFMSRKNSILSLSEPAKCWISWYFHTYKHLKFHAQLSMKKVL